MEPTVDAGAPGGVEDDAPHSKCSSGDEEGGPRFVETELGEMQEIESMCPKCQENGTTRLMITNIPHFREVIVSSFDCPHCGEHNNEVTFGGVFGPKKVRYELSVKEKKDLDRQVVKSEFATITIPELELEIPPESQKGTLNTVEGILKQTKDGLEFQQPLRKVQHPELHDQIAAFCEKLERYRTGDVPFTLILDDPAGNSYIEGRYDYYHPTMDPQLTKYEKERTDIDRQLLGVALDYNTARTEEQERDVEAGVIDDVVQFNCMCPACAREGTMKMKETSIPYFKETVIMAFKCEHCGYKSNEIKTGGKVSEKALRLTLHVEGEEDLKRDVLKSETASLFIPELSLELCPGTLGGFFSTVEGTIMQVKEQLQNLPQVAFAQGDSADKNAKTMLDFVQEIEGLLRSPKFTFILDDPLANVYIQNPRAHLPPPENADPRVEREEYTRTFEQDEELGLHDMNVGEHEPTGDGEGDGEPKDTGEAE